MHRKMCITSTVLFLTLSAIVFGQTDSRSSSTKKTAVNKYYQQFGVIEIPDSMDEVTTLDSSTLKLNDAILIGLVNSPQLKAKGMEINALQASALQAELYPNPEVGLDLENLFGSGNYGSLGQSENTFYVTQDFVLGGRLSAGREVELLKSDLAAWDLERERLALITEIRKTFTVISSLQHQNKLNDQLLKISLDFQENLDRRFKAGKVSQAEIARASLISTSLEILIQNREMELSSEIQKLKALLGNPNLSFNRVENICNLEYNIPEIAELRKSILNSPSLAQYQTDLKRAESAVMFEESIAIPDLSVSLGYRRINETNDNVMVIGASIPIMIFDNNRGSIQEAKIRVDQTKYKYSGMLNSSEARLSLLINNIKGLGTMIEKLDTESLPQARSAFEIIDKGNLVGRFTVLDVLDSQRSLFLLESQYVNAVAEYNRNVIELEELTLTKFNFEKKARILEHE